VLPVSDAPAGQERPVPETVKRFLDTLEREDRILLVLRDQLYEGSWSDMRQDLIDRREGKPYIFKLAQRIDEDIERIDRLCAFEREYAINLSDYLEKECGL
jgi:hypothetical protein